MTDNTLTDKEAKIEAQNKCRELAEERFENSIHNIDSAMDTILGAFDEHGNKIKNIESYHLGGTDSVRFKEFQKILELLKVSNLSNTRLLEISNQLKALSEKIDKVLWIISGIFAHPCSCWVKLLKKESESFLKMTADKPLTTWQIKGTCACGEEIVVSRNIEPDSYKDCLKRNHQDCPREEGPLFEKVICLIPK